MTNNFRVECLSITNHENNQVVLKGWVSKVRKLGNLVFVDLRDRTGIAQLVLSENLLNEAKKLRNEFVISISGKVLLRKTPNLEIVTGKYEVLVEKLDILNEAITTPLIISEITDALDETRFKYRYLDIRRPNVLRSLQFRHQLFIYIRNYLNQKGFIEIETPVLTTPTPEGARDFLVPSRLNPGSFYALPQSPQIFKQLLMIGGVERYFQIVKCFRDEDLRSDRQPEFTQLDLEMSFESKETIMQLIENMIINIFDEIKGIKINYPIQKINYDDAIDKYGSDKPDLRYQLELYTITNIFENSEFQVFANAKKENKEIRSIFIPNVKLSKKHIDTYTETAKKFGINGLAYLIIENNQITLSPIKKYVNEQILKDLIKATNVNVSEGTFLFIKDNYELASNALGQIRTQVAKDFDLYQQEFALCWVINWPLFEHDPITNQFSPAHHPFTRPTKVWENNFDHDLKNAKAEAYDIVINGYEIGGGSLRIYDAEMQNRMFEAIKLSKEEIKNKFGKFINALQYGTPPHGGIALGLDRLVMVLLKLNSIREVIAFPKNSAGVDTMLNAPGEVSDEQLKELFVKKIK
ncbi:MAG: aspartate--tRNA ligase [Mycoplasma sp.]